MALALYHPQLGYYAKQTRQVGRHGDFFTSVSVGPLFGKLLARRFLDWWRHAGSPDRWRIIEAGAHDGTLAADILEELRTLDPAAFSKLEYAIPEPLPLLQAAQRETLTRFPAILHLDDPADLADHPLPGIAFGNEVLDALPFHVIEWQSGTWHECLVDVETSRFVWKVAPEPFHQDLSRLGTDFREGYRTEVRTNHADFFRPLLAGLQSGLLLWPDYGHSQSDYYHPDRTTGTLRTFSKHQAGENPLESPGAIDITAHVDFTAAARAAMELGCRPAAFRMQSTWLTTLARDWLLSFEGRPDPAAMRQFASLTHPGHLGSRFHILELSWNDPTAPPLSPLDRGRLEL